MSFQRFLDAQQNTYEVALREIRAGRKQTHWMWFVFPQLKGLGRSSTAHFYGLSNLQEAVDYLQHPVLGERLREITDALLKQPDSDAHSVFGSPDDLKLHSSLTLFAEADAPETSVFDTALNRFFSGRRDPRTLDLLYGDDAID